jgi:peptidoglycan-N-acetylglucosamine deacetylase
VDLDPAWVVCAAMARPAPDPDPFLPAFDRWLDLLDEAGVRATFFAIGRDLERPAFARRLREAADAGHEIGNHSLSHAFAFSSLPVETLRREVLETQSRISDAVGELPAGFRAPAYHMDPECLALLAECGIRYDASLLPSPAIYVRRLLAAVRYGPFSPAARSIGRTWHLGEPSRPHRRAGLWEVPMTVLPGTGVPLSSSLYLHLPRRAQDWLIDAGLRLDFTQWSFHLRDLADPESDRFPSRVGRAPAAGLPIEKKRADLGRLLAALSADGSVRPIRDWLA